MKTQERSHKIENDVAGLDEAQMWRLGQADFHLMPLT
jgi:hypothetical protein